MKTTLRKYMTTNTFSGMFGSAFSNILKIAKRRGLT